LPIAGFGATMESKPVTLSVQRSMRIRCRIRAAPLRSLGPLVLFVLLVLLTSACATGPTDTGPPEDSGIGPFALNARLGRGVNFGNALEAPSEGAWGVTLRALHFQRAAEAGFETVRLPVRWSAHALESAPYTVDRAFFERVDWAIEQALANGLNVVLNVHHYEELVDDPPAHRARWLAIWRQVAARYADQPDGVVFELLNEPYGPLDATLWNDFLRDGLAAVRETNPVRNVVVGPVSWNNTDALPGLDLPGDDRLIVTVHFYEPFRFTHQGAGWVDGSEPWLGTEWNGTPDEKAYVTEILERAAAWGRDHQRPLFVGEFGAYERADLASRARWTGWVAREAERLGMSWAYWEFMAGFGLYDREADAFREPLLDALVPDD
jgi:endoglucanase